MGGGAKVEWVRANKKRAIYIISITCQCQCRVGNGFRPDMIAPLRLLDTTLIKKRKVERERERQGDMFMKIGRIE